LQYFIMDDDIFGYSLLGLLYQKVLEGVKVRILLDARGTKKLTRKIFSQDMLQTIAQYNNAEVRVYNAVLDDLASIFTDVRKVMASNHDKIIVIDDEYAIVGGRNVSRDYYLDPSDHDGAYRDCDVLIKNEQVALQLKQAFEEEFHGLVTNEISEGLIKVTTQEDKLNAAREAMASYLYGNLLAPRSTDNKKFKNYLATFNKELAVNKKLSDYSAFGLYDSAVNAPVKIIDKNSFLGDRNDITEQVIKYIDGAKREVMIQNPYVVLSERMFNALKRADKRGTPIIMHTNSPASTDSLLTQAMFYADWKRIFEEIPSIKIYVYTGANKLHAKTWVFDRKVGVVGTYNLDYMSEQINSEVVAAVKSDEFAKQLRTSILSDVAISAQYKYGVNEDGVMESVGPDDYQGKNYWILKLASKFSFLKFLI
jgi:putative cardiolipin synthase